MGSPQEIRRLLHEGLEHYLAGRLKEATEAWQQVMALDPVNARAREYLRAAMNEYGPLKRREAEAAKQSGPTGWDDGPSIAAELQVNEPVADDGLPDLAAPPRPKLPEGERRQLGQLIRTARERYALHDFTGVLEVLQQVAGLDPSHAEAARMREDCVETLVAMYETRFGDLAGVPVVVERPDQMIWLNLDHRAGFVLAQIDGATSYDDLYAVCGMSRLDTARILAQLVEEKVIRTK